MRARNELPKYNESFIVVCGENPYRYGFPIEPRQVDQTRSNDNRAQPNEIGPTLTVFILSLGDPRLKLEQHLPVTLEHFEGVVTAWNSDMEEYGSGKTEAEALDDLRVAIVETYFLLRDEGEKNLGPIPKRQWNYIKTIVRES